MKRLALLAAIAGGSYFVFKFYKTAQVNPGLGVYGAYQVATGAWPLDTSDGLVD